MGDFIVTVTFKHLERSVEARDVEQYILKFYPKSKPRADTPIVIDDFGNKSAIARFRVIDTQDLNGRAVEKLDGGELRSGQDSQDVSKPSVQQDFLGMTVVAQSHIEPQFDFYFIHGIRSGAYKAFKAKINETGGECFWPRDLLPNRLERIGGLGRYSTFGYDSSFRRPDPTSIEITAEELLNEIIAGRPEGCERPIFFCSHSLGGLIVCQALIFAMKGSDHPKSTDNFKRSFAPNGKFLVEGVIFFGTPFKGSILASLFMDPIARTVRLNRDFLKDLKPKNRIIKNMLSEFDVLRLRSETRVPLIIFWEEKPMQKFFLRSIVTDRESAYGYFRDYVERFPLKRDHGNMCKFVGDLDEDFRGHVAPKILALVWRALENIVLDGRGVDADAVGEHALARITPNEPKLQGLSYQRSLLTNTFSLESRLSDSNIDPIELAHMLGFSNFDRKLNDVRRALPGTCDWILDKAPYKAWIDPPQDSVLFIRGGTGWGKSVLSRFIFEEIRNAHSKEDDVIILRFFCGTSGQVVSPKSIIQHALWHLCLKYPIAMHRVASDALIRQGGRTINYFWNLFLALKNQIKFQVFYIVDGINECVKDLKENGDTTVDAVLVQFLRDVCLQLTGPTEGNTGTCKVIFTTQRIPEFLKIFDEFEGLVFDIKVEDVTAGVEKMIDEDVTKFVTKRKLSAEIEQLIKTDLKSKAGPMFQWVWSVIRRLEELSEASNTLGAFAAELEKYIPSNIENPYAETIKEIKENSTLSEDDKILIASVLQFLVLAEKTVDLEDLQYAMASRSLHNSAEKILSHLPQNLEFLLQSSCSNLVVIDDGHVRLAHQSVKTFLLNLPSKSHFSCQNAESGHQKMLEMCLNMLLTWVEIAALRLNSKKEDHGQSFDATPDALYNISGTIPFSGYAICFWDSHLRNVGKLKDCWLRMGATFENQRLWLFMMRERDRLEQYNNEENREATWQHLSVATFLAKQNLIAVIKGCSLSEPIRHKDWNSLRLFRKKGRPALNVLSQDRQGDTMLHYAAWNGSSSLIEYLLQNGLAGDIRNHSGETPLTRAMVGDKEKAAIQLISAKAAYLETPNEDKTSSLQAAAIFDSIRAGEYLLDCQLVSPNEDTGWEGRSPLYLASYFNNLNMARLLLERHADPCKEVSVSKETALHAASMEGNIKILKLLFSFKEDLNAAPQDTNGWTPLHHAAANGHEDVFDFLYKQQPLVSPSKYGSFPVHMAAESGHISIMRKFTRNEPFTQNPRSGSTPLHMAAVNGQLEIVEYLLDVLKVPVDARRLEFRAPESVPREEAFCTTPLINAIAGKKEAVANTLIQHGADIHAMTYNGASTLMLAVENDLHSLVDELLRLGMDPTILTHNRVGILHAAAAQSTPNMLLKMLPCLKEQGGFNIDQQTIEGQTALMSACAANSKDNIQLLLKEGSDIFTTSENGHSAVFFGDYDLLSIYIDRAGDLNSRDRSGMSILHHAAASGNANVIKVLLKHNIDIDAVSLINETPLLLAITNMNIEATNALITGGADLNLRDASGRRAIEYLTSSSPLVKLLKPETETVVAGKAPTESKQNLGRFVYEVIKNTDSKPALSIYNFWQDYTELAFLLLCMGAERDVDTRVCLETRLTAVHGEKTRYARNCNGCSKHSLEGALHICRICYMKILCHKCYEKRVKGKKNAPPKGCMPEHEYLDFGGADWRSLAPGTVNAAGETLKDFLDRIREEFRDAELVPRANGEALQGPTQSEPGDQTGSKVEVPDLADGVGEAIPKS